MELYEELETRFKEFVGDPGLNMVSCSSGTSALHLGLEALQLPPGSKVLVPDFCMYAVPRAIVMAGHIPVFVDCHREDLNLCILPDPMLKDVKAVIAVHNYGRRCEMDYIAACAFALGWKVIEDLAEAHGVQPNLNTDVACWSFYKNKIVAGEEGGMVAFRDSNRAHLARSLRCLGFTEAHDFTHIPRGFNARMSNAHAELVLKSLKYVGYNKELRAGRVLIYDRIIPEEYRMPTRHANWVYDVRIKKGNRQRLSRIVTRLNNLGVQARLSFLPNSLQEEFRGRVVKPKEEAIRASEEVMYLPLHPLMADEEVHRNATQFLKAVKEEV